MTGRARSAWLQHAACGGHDPELWFGITPADVSAAVRICHRCPVRGDCLNDAHTRGDDWAILGGETPAQRRQRQAHLTRTAS